jgi:hypothetical protein
MTRKKLTSGGYPLTISKGEAQPGLDLQGSIEWIKRAVWSNSAHEAGGRSDASRNVFDIAKIV